jgi:hypothetical protein
LLERQLWFFGHEIGAAEVDELLNRTGSDADFEERQA